MSVETREPDIKELDGITAGPVKIYTHERFYIKDSEGRICKIRCSFDEDKFILRSVAIVKESRFIREGEGYSKAVLGEIIPIKDIILSDTRDVRFEQID